MYMLFVLNNKGVPSWGRMARMNISATAAAAIAATPQGGSALRRGPPWSDPLWEKRLPKGFEKLMLRGKLPDPLKGPPPPAPLPLTPPDSWQPPSARP
jgi:hypothetical protein